MAIILRPSGSDSCHRGAQHRCSIFKSVAPVLIVFVLVANVDCHTKFHLQLRTLGLAVQAPHVPEFHSAGTVRLHTNGIATAMKDTFVSPFVVTLI